MRAVKDMGKLGTYEFTKIRYFRSRSEDHKIESRLWTTKMHDGHVFGAEMKLLILDRYYLIRFIREPQQFWRQD